MEFILSVLASVIGVYIALGIPVGIGIIIAYVKIAKSKKAVKSAYENLMKGIDE